MLFLSANLLIFLTTAFAYSAWKVVRWRKQALAEAPEMQIDTVVQTGPEREALPTLFLEEVLAIAKDKPTSYYTFSPSEARKRLLETSVIKEARVKKVKPSSIFIDYERRRPIALVTDFINRAVDRDLELFPFSPFFQPQRLPEIFLGLTKFEGSLQKSPEMHLALDVLDTTTELSIGKGISLCRIDVSRRKHPSLGKREIVVVVAKGEMKHYLRLSPKKYREEFGNYLTICDKIAKEGRQDYDRIVDFRLSDLAFIEECERSSDRKNGEM